MSRVSPERSVIRLTVGAPPSQRRDALAGEEPLELRVNGRSMAVTIRTPGADFDLAAGFLVSEGVIGESRELVAMRYCAGNDESGVNQFNVLDLSLAADVAPPSSDVARAFFTTSSCGLCGKASIDAVRTKSRFDVAPDTLRVAADVVVALPERLREAQRVFDRTGGLHAAALFDANGEMLVVREDVGRHNAVDKVVGHALMHDLFGDVLVVSGRAGFEIVQKAAMAGIPVVVAVSAPTSLSVDAARECGLTLAAFVRGGTLNLYSGGERLGPHADAVEHAAR